VVVAQRVRDESQGPEGAPDLDEDSVIGRRNGALHDRSPRTARERVGDELVSITLIAQREEALATRDEPRVERAAGESQTGVRAAAHDPPAARGEQSLEREQRRRC